MKRLLLASAMLLGMVGFASAQEGAKATAKSKKHLLGAPQSTTAAAAADQKKIARLTAEKKKADDATQQPLMMRTKTKATGAKAKTN